MNQKIIEAFEVLGLTKKESKVLALIVDMKIVTTREFERLLDMRQPEVSMTLKALQTRGWIRNTNKVKIGTMLRAGKAYELAYALDEIVGDLKKQADKKQNEKINSLKVLGDR